ncbi:hypothetical protein RJ640_005847 [Escallonia rubra]|uniref:GAG-pre-integrase domain-containing protein n=1 Tax=Escallonia rubra TaxID=112253 RepID=A0AA88UEJ5_9ASTE|nr:hypothetical protein RJ640_005847 [Escallonia rubra]
MEEGSVTTSPPLLKNDNYSYWKNCMRNFMRQDTHVWYVVENGPIIPMKDGPDGTKIPKGVLEMDAHEAQLFSMDDKAKNIISCGFEMNEYNHVSACETAREMWRLLEVTHEGTNQVKETKINMLVQQYEAFKMKEHESINEMYSIFTFIINGLKLLGKIYPEKEIVRKVLRSLPKRWEAKLTAIQEANDLNVLKLEELVGSLMTHEITMKIRDEEETTSKKKNLALKADTSHEPAESSDDSDPEMALITRRFKKFLASKRDGKIRRNPTNQSHQRNNSDWNVKENSDACYECVTETSEDDDVAQLCFMAKDDHSDKNGRLVTFGDNSNGKIIGKGKIGTGSISIDNVSLVDGLKFNLISISQLIDSGHKVKFEGDQCLISHASAGGTLVGKRDGNIYTLSFDAFDSSHEVCLSAQHNDIWLWHRRLGHVHMDLIKKFISKELVRGLPKLKFVKDKACPKESHLIAVKRIFKYLSGTLNLGLWYPRNSSLDLVGFSDFDYAGCLVDRKSTSGTCQFLGDALVSWHSKKQTSVALSTAEAEYVAAGSCCAQVLWMRQTLRDFGVSIDHIPIMCDSSNAIDISKNHVQHSCTKHIDIRHHFLRDNV